MSWERFESYGYWALFITTFLGVALWESSRPRRQLLAAPERRWGKHAILLLLSTVITAGLYRAGSVVVALSVAGSPYGLLNKPWLPFIGRCIATVLLLDLVQYAMHRLFHSVSFLWQVHQVHHSDPDFDLSTAARVHPIEAVLIEGANLAAIVIFAPPVAGVVIAEFLRVFQSLFGHANTSLPKWAEQPLRRVFVTPDMHRIHHSEIPAEQFRNFGGNFSWWDHLFRTYLAGPAAGQERMRVGLKGYQDETSLGLGFMLALPFLPAKKELAPAASRDNAAGKTGTT